MTIEKADTIDIEDMQFEASHNYWIMRTVFKSPTVIHAGDTLYQHIYTDEDGTLRVEAYIRRKEINGENT